MTYICFPGSSGSTTPTCAGRHCQRVWGWETPTHQQAVKAVCPDSSLPFGPLPYQMLFSCLLPFYLHVLPPICHTLPICNIQEKKIILGISQHVLYSFMRRPSLSGLHTPLAAVSCVCWGQGLPDKTPRHQLLSGWRKKGFPPSLALVQHIKEKLLEAPEPTDNSSWSQANQRTQSMGTRRTKQALCIPCQDPNLCQSWANNVPIHKPNPKKTPGRGNTPQFRREDPPEHPEQMLISKRVTMKNNPNSEFQWEARDHCIDKNKGTSWEKGSFCIKELLQIKIINCRIKNKCRQWAADRTWEETVSDLKCSLEGVLQEPEEKDKGGEIWGKREAQRSPTC